MHRLTDHAAKSCAHFKYRDQTAGRNGQCRGQDGGKELVDG